MRWLTAAAVTSVHGIGIANQQQLQLRPSDLESEFTRFDSNHDLFLDLPEVRAMVHALHIGGHVSTSDIPSVASKLATALDIDGDGQISLPEFLAEFPAPKLASNGGSSSVVENAAGVASAGAAAGEANGCLCEWACGRSRSVQ